MSQAVAAKAETKDPRDVYFVNPWIDVLVAGGGLSIVFFLIVCVSGWAPTVSLFGHTFGGARGYDRPEWAWKTAFYLSFVVNYPHFAATNFRLYQSFDRMMQFPKTSFLSPVVVVAGMGWALIDKSGFAPWYVKIFLTWSGYHFCAQTKGIALLYSRRLGVEIDSITRSLIVIAAHAPWLYAVVNLETFQDGGPYYSVTVPRGIPFPFVANHVLALPAVLELPVRNAAMGIFFVGLGAILLLFARTMIVQKRIFPVAAALPIVAQTLWFGPVGAGSRAFNEFVPFFHSFQYLILAWLFQLKEESARGGFLPGLETVVWETAKWLFFVILGGIALFEIWPRAIAFAGYDLQHSLGCVNAAIQIHHFFVDGVIWKIRDPRTRAMLAGNLYDLAGMPRTA